MNARALLKAIRDPDRALPYGALAFAGIAIFAFRYLLLLAYPYPPSGDAGGDLYLAHAWLGHGLPQLPQSLQTPPLYYFAVVIPFTTAFPTFEGIELYMAFVPALLVLPSYLLARETGAGRWSSVAGAALLGLSSIWSLMVTWNAAFNLFGILLLLVFLVALARYVRAPSLRGAAFVGLALFLVGLAHPLTFLVAAIVLAFTAFVRLFEPGRRVRRLVVDTVVPAACCLPLIYFYLPSSQSVTTGGGGGSFASQIFWAFQNGPFFAWGYQGATLAAIVGVDLLVSAAALAHLARRPAARPVLVGLAGVLVASIVVVLLDPANAVRALYFLPIPFLVPVPAWLDRWAVGAGTAAAPRSILRGRIPGPARTALVAAFAAGLLVLNAGVSQGVMTSGIQFNESLRPDDVAAMDWIRNHTPANATFFDGANLEPWMWGYAERMDYASTPLGIEVTAASERSALLSAYIDLGSNLLTDPYWVVSSSLPSPIGSPQVEIATPGYWEPFLGSDASSDEIEVDTGHGTQWLGLQYAALSNRSSSQLPNGTQSYDFGLNWTSLGETIGTSMTLDGPDFGLSWSSGNVSVLSVDYAFGIPPSGYFFTYDSVPTVANATSIVDRFSMGSETFSVTMTGGRFTQRAVAGGWTQLWYYGGPRLTVTTVGMQPQNDEPSGPVATSTLLAELGIDHAIVDVDRDFGMYDRLRAGVFWDGPSETEYQNGTVVVFGR